MDKFKTRTPRGENVHVKINKKINTVVNLTASIVLANSRELAEWTYLGQR